MKFHLKIMSLSVVFLILAGCSHPPEATQLAPTIQVDTMTSTATPKSSLTPQPTRTNIPVPTTTNTPWVTKEILAQFGIFGGDGGWDYYAFIGGDMPKWVLYTDGQLIVQKQDENGIWFEETTLSVSQMCSFLSQIEQLGFFTLEANNSFEPAYPTDNPNPIYNFDDTTQFSEGAPNYVLQVNGSKHKQIYVYSRYVQYLVPDARRVFNLFSNYSPLPKLTDYQAQYMLLRIEEGLGDSIYSTPTPITQTWSTDILSLERLAKENVETEASPYFSTNITQALITGDMVKPIFEIFGNRLAYKLFQSDERVYYVVARPLLPHETLNNFSGFPREKEFDSPFSCSN